MLRGLPNCTATRGIGDCCCWWRMSSETKRRARRIARDKLWLTMWFNRVEDIFAGLQLPRLILVNDGQFVVLATARDYASGWFDLSKIRETNSGWNIEAKWREGHMWMNSCIIEINYVKRLASVFKRIPKWTAGLTRLGKNYLKCDSPLTRRKAELEDTQHDMQQDMSSQIMIELIFRE